ncbi:hypothetical protein PFISCL1PPCAC_711 [Pristionchus fissidentatus]|uniref:Uncharacterized protein n=1 Tax=Pristionchus fissidentatus TaxID=1538716 RepID=A0AAV5UUN2_9BILA|nr:hypothetical protein PFISCL1PPCAC_711 [Pristionchus fissidentatus]
MATRRSHVSVYNQDDANRYLVPLDLLRQYTVIHINFEEVCVLHARVLWINSTADVGALNLKRDKICDELARMKETIDQSNNSTITDDESSGYSLIDSLRDLSLLPLSEGTSPANFSENLLLPYLDENGTLPETILFNSPHELIRFDLGISPKYFHHHKSVGFHLEKACKAGKIEALGKDLHGRFGEELSGLGFDPLEIDQIIHGGSNLDDMLLEFSNTQQSDQRPFPATALLPFLKRINYDARSPPSFYSKEKVIVKTGMHDYEMDLWLRMAWRDLRLAHGLSKPILVNEYTFLKKIWRPDPFFTNAREATFHRVTYLNFYVFIFPNGDVLMEMRTLLKNSCPLLVLCKYPHDSQVCGTRISSIGMTQHNMEFQWFSRPTDAVRFNSNLQMPELVLTATTTQQCDGNRKSGNYSCIEALFQLDRNVRFHLASTYIPTAMCVVFSWISVWLPEEFVEGRIFVSLTVFLTLSAENSSAKESLPKVSYIKAIDYWFGFSSTFVFLTMMQALIVISLEHTSRAFKKDADAEIDNNRYRSMLLLLESRKYHKWARNLDSFCKVMYPVIFLIFLMIYAFVITEGPEDKCLRKVWK